MKEEIKTKWLKALRSGEYTQAGTLICETGGQRSFCCLGVLNDISNLGEWRRGEDYVCPSGKEGAFDRFLADGGDPQSWDEEQEYLYTKRENQYAHDLVVEWAGLTDKDPELRVTDELANKYHLSPDPDDFTLPISQLNDFHMSFLELADLIEEQL